MQRALRIFTGFLVGAVVGGLLGLAWGWLVLFRKSGGIDYPELNMLVRSIQWMAVVNGATGAFLVTVNHRRSFLIGWALGALLSLALAFVAARVEPGLNYRGPFLWFFLAAVLLPPLAGFLMYFLFSHT